ETTTSISRPSAIGAHDLVVAEPLAAADGPAEEGDLRAQAGALDEARADQRAGTAQGLRVVGLDPELERGAPLHAVGAVFGGEEGLGGLDGSTVGVAEDGAQALLAVLGRGRIAHPAERQQAAVAEDDSDRSSQDLLLAHRRAGY